MSKRFQYIYGPVPSWRLGSSLGIDLLSHEEKICSFDCSYCQLGRTDVLRTERKLYVPVEEMMKEIESLPDISIDYFTFSGRGEPTLAINIGEAVRAIKSIRHEKIAVITNSSLIPNEEVQRDLLAADFIIAKLDAPTEDIFVRMNRPEKSLNLEDILGSLIHFGKKYRGKLALQVMFTEGNRDFAAQIAEIARNIGPEEVQINTPLRPCDENPLPAGDLLNIKAVFESKTLNSMTVYESAKKDVILLSDKDTLRRRGKEA